MGYPSSVDSGGVFPWQVIEEGISPQTTSGTLTTNQVYLWLFEVYAPTTITGMRYRTGSTATGTADLGIYDANGNLLVHSGATSNSASATPVLTFANALSIAPGRYMMALCPSNNTDTYLKFGSLGAGLTRAAGCANAGSAGVLPSTTGALSTAGQIPIMEVMISGGAP